MLPVLEENMKYQEESNIMRNWEEEGNSKRKLIFLFDRIKKRFKSTKVHPHTQTDEWQSENAY